MRRWSEILVLVVVVSFGTSLFAQQETPKRATAYATAVEIPFESTPTSFLKLPAGLYLGEAMALARNSKGEIFVFTRSGLATKLLEFDAEGNYLREIGEPDS